MNFFYNISKFYTGSLLPAEIITEINIVSHPSRALYRELLADINIESTQVALVNSEPPVAELTAESTPLAEVCTAGSTLLLQILLYKSQHIASRD
jgi:hypothetical protein